MLVYGLGKIVQFEEAIAVNKTVDEMSGMQLMWVFYGYSKPFVITSGVFEIIGGILLLIKKTRLMGCLFSSTILVNVILQDILYGVHIGALKAAIIYQILIVIILWLNKDRVIKGMKILLTSNKIQQSKAKFFIKLIVAFLLFLVLRITEYYLTIK